MFLSYDPLTLLLILQLEGRLHMFLHHYQPGGGPKEEERHVDVKTLPRPYISYIKNKKNLLLRVTNKFGPKVQIYLVSFCKPPLSNVTIYHNGCDHLI